MAGQRRLLAQLKSPNPQKAPSMHSRPTSRQSDTQIILGTWTDEEIERYEAARGALEALIIQCDARANNAAGDAEHAQWSAKHAAYVDLLQNFETLSEPQLQEIMDEAQILRGDGHGQAGENSSFTA
ncbi:hypothetical protein [Streptacidiphilus anmyonensis]|uniref:hypothetical protein n=1 Tax=Streptacidiphilus anmyonensis TaxID=405782 RepID=UPI00128BD294|nr:hypothetical protein [Streptacidiphilus anmyonensis]